MRLRPQPLLLNPNPEGEGAHGLLVRSAEFLSGNILFLGLAPSEGVCESGPMCGAREMFADRPLRGVSLNLAFSCLVPPPSRPDSSLPGCPPAHVCTRCASSERTPRHLGWRSCTRQWASRPLLQRSLALLSCFGSLERITLTRGVCVGGGGRAFYYTYVHSQSVRPCAVADLLHFRDHMWPKLLTSVCAKSTSRRAP